MELSQGEIARKLKKSVSTISREIARNTGFRGYRFHQADRLACGRRSHASRKPKKLTDELKADIDCKGSRQL